MAENQNDPRNQNTGDRSKQNQESGKTKETDPNNPTANQGTDKGNASKGSSSYQSGTQTQRDSGNNPLKDKDRNKTVTDEDESEIGEKENREMEERESQKNRGRENDNSGNKGRM